MPTPVGGKAVVAVELQQVQGLEKLMVDFIKYIIRTHKENERIIKLC